MVNVKSAQQNKMYINGEWVSALSGEVFDVVNPATGEVIETVPFAKEKEAVLAVAAANQAFPEWSEKTAGERSSILMNWFHLVIEHKEEIASILTSEQGKTLTEARGEVEYAASYISWNAEEAKRINGETIPSSSRNKRIMVIKQPIGVIAAITPWNFPAAMFTRKIATALAAGCTAVIKPAESTPLTALKLTELAHQAGLPKGVLNVVTGDPKTIGKAWLDDDRVKKITFTGSTPVGKYLMKEAANTVKKVSLELGGHAPVLIFNDADLDKAIDGVIASKFRNSGQTCICANRIYVQKGILPKFLEEFKKEVAKIKVGIGTDPEVNIGPVINEAGYQKVQRQVDDAVEKGATVEVGGKRIIQYPGGYFFEPTILCGVNDEMLIMKEETFGPVAPIIPFEDPEEAIKQANNSDYGLAAYAYTENLSMAFKVSEKLEYGIVGINDGLPSTAQAPFGGIKQSGIGREGGHQGIEEFLESKYISIQI